MSNKKCKILFKNGVVLDGLSFGFIGTTGGEVCFNTGMTGYQEILTDPSYSGQIITMTYPHIGNYGINDDDVESGKIQCSGLLSSKRVISHLTIDRHHQSTIIYQKITL